MATNPTATKKRSEKNEVWMEIDPADNDDIALNEQKTWEELNRIKAMSIPMAKKKQLKAQLATLPKRQLTGCAKCKWNLTKCWTSCVKTAANKYRRTIFLNNSLRKIEFRSGTAIVNVFLFIKWTLFLNLAISILLLLFVIGPFSIDLLVRNKYYHTNINYSLCNSTSSIEDEKLDMRNATVFQNLLICCQTKFEDVLRKRSKGKESRGIIDQAMQLIHIGRFDRWPVTYGFYNEAVLNLGNRVTYLFDVAYVLTGCAIFFGSLILLLYGITRGVKEIIHRREGEFYKYSNLLFGGWEHYTHDQKGAAFKRRLLRTEMKMALQSDKRQITDLFKTKKQQAKIFVVRVFINIVVLLLCSGAGFITYEVVDNLRKHAGHNKFKETIEGFLPTLTISFFNLIFPIILSRLGKLENYKWETETGLLLFRALVVRLITLFIAARSFRESFYCNTVNGHCTKCQKGEFEKQRSPCWESLFADQIYRLFLTELLVKLVLTFIVDPTRRLIGYCFNRNRIIRKVGILDFNIVRHSLDIIYIQTLSWLSFYFAPFAPILAVFYCICIFYIKKFSVLYNCKSVGETYRTIRSTGIFMIAKISSFFVVLFTYAYVIVNMRPSVECGPFKGRNNAWESVSSFVEDKCSWLQTVLVKVGSPVYALPISLVLIIVTYYHYSVAQANRAMLETLRHLLILEGHDKHFLFSKLTSFRRTRRVARKYESTQLAGIIKRRSSPTL